jgi:thiol-disulfide isomerase/thioredoxin
MKSLVVVTLLLLSGVCVTAQDSNLTWHTSLEDAKNLSKKSHKPILLYFTGSDWCPPCIALKKDFFESAEFETRSKDFVLLLIDYPRRMDILSEEQMAYNKEIVAKYNKDKSFPKLLILNDQGNELGRLSGYSSYSTDKDTSYHFAFVDKHSSRNN